MNANQQDEFNPQLYFMVLESNRLTMVNVENQSNELLTKLFVELKVRFPLPDIKVSASQERSSLEEKIYAILTTWLKKKELNNVHGQVIRDGFFSSTQKKCANPLGLRSILCSVFLVWSLHLRSNVAWLSLAYDDWRGLGSQMMLIYILRVAV